MKEPVQRHADLVNLIRWGALFFLILLLATPHLRHQEQEAQAVAFEGARPTPHAQEKETIEEASLQGQEEDGPGDYVKIFPEMDMELEVEEPSMVGIPGSMVPMEDRDAALYQEFGPKPAKHHVASPSRQEQPVKDSESKGPSIEKEKPRNPYDSIIQKAAKRYEVDPALVKALIMAESSYNPRAVSRKGARGLMQLMPKTARALGVEDSFDPEDNIDAGVRYFKQLLKQFDGDLKLAIAAYNAGSRKVRMYKGVPPFKYTRYYVAKVIEYHQRYQQ